MKQEASISWEAQFEVPAGDDGKGGEVWLPWGMFSLTYRGRPVNDDGRKLERDKVRQVGIMMRRYVMHLSSRFFLSPLFFSFVDCFYPILYLHGIRRISTGGYFVLCRTSMTMLLIYIFPHSDSFGVLSYFDTQQGDFELELRSIIAKSEQN